MNICLIITNLSGGGAERATIDLAKTLKEQNHHVTIILLENKVSYSVLGEEIHYIVNENELLDGWIGKRRLAKKLKNLWVQLNKKKFFDITISRLPFANEISMLANIENLYLFIDNALSQEVEKLKKSKPLKAFRKNLRYRQIYSGRNLIAVSEGVKKDLVEYFQFDKEKIKVIYNPIFINDITKKSLVFNSDIPKQKYIIHIGRVSGQKRHDLILDAWNEIKTDYLLLLLSDNPTKLDEMVIARGMELKVKILPFQDNPYPFIKHAELLVLCSDFEGFGLVLAESIICKTPVISTNCKYGPSEILGKEYFNYLVPVNDKKSLSRKISSLISGRKKALNINLDRFYPSHIAKKIMQLDSNKSALFIKTKNIGDSIILTSAIEALPPQYNSVDVICLPESKEIFEMHPRVRNIFVIPRALKGIEKFKSYINIVKIISKCNYDLIIQFSSDWRGAILSRIKKPRLSIVKVQDHNKRGKFFYNSFKAVVPFGGYDRHSAESDVDFLRRCNLFTAPTAPAYHLEVPKYLNQKINTRYQSKSGKNKKLIVIHPSSRWKFKEIKPETWAEVINYYHRKKFTVIINGSKSDYIYNKIISELTLIKPNLTAFDSLTDSAALIKSAHLVISIDSMTIHLASALKVPIVSIFGPTSEVNWGPWKVPHQIVAMSTKDDPSFTCRPCGEDGCGGCKVSSCLLAITSKDIITKTNALLKLS
jgi:ADP-heptose:LPS heptosyltransferase/glycosyltransferase involved in cell wall biosynthesis